jgi:protocatechuate 3,4-dioxygenase beta subunit
MNLRSTRFSAFIATLLLMMSATESHAAGCRPTEPDMLGPFYKPDAPVRASVGEGYMLKGTVRSSQDCAPVAGARMEFWLAGPDGEYDDTHRATVFSDAAGSYLLRSNVPQPYFGRPPHIHIRVSAEEFKTLVTQHYPKPGQHDAGFDLVLIPSR